MIRVFVIPVPGISSGFYCHVDVRKIILISLETYRSLISWHDFNASHYSCPSLVSHSVMIVGNSPQVTKSMSRLLSIFFCRWIVLRIVISHLFWEVWAKVKNFASLSHLYLNHHNLAINAIQMYICAIVHSQKKLKRFWHQRPKKRLDLGVSRIWKDSPTPPMHKFKTI